MTTKEHVIYRLNAQCGFDEQVKAHVGYIPRLRVFTQARTKEDLAKALQATATQFILACANKGILASVLREAGCHGRKVTAQEMAAAAEGDQEFIAVAGYEECAAIEVTVPMELIVAQEAVAVA